MTLFSRELLTRVLVTSEQDCRGALCLGPLLEEHRRLLLAGVQHHGRAERCIPRFHLRVMYRSLKLSRSKWQKISPTPMRCHTSQSCSWHVPAVLDLKPLGFPEKVHSPSSSAESELLLLSLMSFRAHNFFLLGKDFCRCIVVAGGWFRAGLVSCSWVSPHWVFWLEEIKLLVMGFIFRGNEEHLYKFLYKYLWLFFFFNVLVLKCIQEV